MRRTDISNQLLDHLVSLRKQRRWHLDAQHLGRLQIDDELELSRTHDWQVGRFFALKDAASIDACLARQVRTPRSVAHEPAGFDKISEIIDRRHPVTRRLRNELHATISEQRVGIDHEGIDPFFHEACKRGIDVEIGADGKDFNL
jgi:hypothetical protein